jgi:SAM-dependent methyltransferase
MTAGPDNKKIYDETWRDWVDMKIYGPASRWLRSLIKRHLATLRSRHASIETVLDVGCGEGTITHLLAQQLPEAQILGIDFSESGIDCADQAYKRSNLEFRHDERSAAMNTKYDLVTAFEVLEHIDDWQSFLERIAAASNKYLLLSFPTGRMRPFEVNVGHFRNYKKGQIEEFLKTRGFTPIKVFYAGFPFYNPLYREFCNLTNSGSNSFTRGKYGWKQKTIGWIIYFVFRFLSTRSHSGDQFCGLFVRAQVVKK